MAQNKKPGCTLKFLYPPIDRTSKEGFYIPPRKTPVPPRMANQFRSIQLSLKETVAELTVPPKIPRIETNPPFEKKFEHYPND